MHRRHFSRRIPAGPVEPSGSRVAIFAAGDRMTCVCRTGPDTARTARRWVPARPRIDGGVLLYHGHDEQCSRTYDGAANGVGRHHRSGTSLGSIRRVDARGTPPSVARVPERWPDQQTNHLLDASTVTCTVIVAVAVVQYTPCAASVPTASTQWPWQPPRRGNPKAAHSLHHVHAPLPSQPPHTHTRR